METLGDASGLQRMGTVPRPPQGHQGHQGPDVAELEGGAVIWHPTVTFRERGRFNQKTTSAERSAGGELARLARREFLKRQEWRLLIDRSAAFAAADRSVEWVKTGRRDGGRVEESFRQRLVEDGYPPPGEGFLE